LFFKSVYFRIFVLMSLVLGIVGYSKINKYFFDSYIQENSGPILSVLPDFQFKEIKLDSQEEIQNSAIKVLGANENGKGVVVHFWATWCAPCEVELPSFIALAKNFESRGIKFLLMAINDDEAKVRKFMRRFSENMPSNIVLGLDSTDASSRLLGTVKIPETYIFNSAGYHLKKYVGPQEWDKPTYLERFNNLLK
jgi:cytochrome c biogenesis protein CcmG/thiol:disulfide interchange protein DsbE